MAKRKPKRPFGAVKIQYKGCLYHSLLELKFIILIEDKCSWIREPIAVHYNPDTLKVTNYLNENMESNYLSLALAAIVLVHYGFSYDRVYWLLTK